MKTALVTGASRGLGFEIAKQLAERGYRVLTPTRAELDLADPDSLRCWAPDCTGLDVLVNNAAVLGKSLEEAMQVNAFSAYNLTRHLWFLLSARSGRVVNISSREGLSTQFGFRYYSASKTTLNAITRMLSCNTAGITVNACCPGWFRSRLGGDHAERSPAEAADTPVWLATEASPSLNGKFFINREVVPW